MTGIDWFTPGGGIDNSLASMWLKTWDRLVTSSLEELVKSSGKVDALAAIKPYERAARYMMVDQTREAMNIKGCGPDSLLALWLAGQACAVHPKDQLGQVAEKGAVEIVKACTFQCENPDICIFLSHFGTESFCEIVNPEYECVITHHLTNGDPYCRFVFKKRSDSIGVIDDPGNVLVTLPTLEIPEDKLYGMHMMMDSGCLNGITTAFIDLQGSEEATKTLVRNAKAIGREMGEQLLEGYPELGDDKSVMELVESLGNLMAQQGSSSVNARGALERKITSCPNQTWTREFCHQYEALIQGMLESIDPSLDFSYDKMIPNGDEVCHWCLKKKPDMLHIDAPLKILKMRFAKGEVNEVEYKRMRELLQE